MACISYNPSRVTYRQNNLSRQKLLAMRKTLIDKCEEVINSNDWPHGEADLRTAKIFKDLLQFYGTMDQSIYSEASGANIHDQTTLPQSNASFMPAISQKTFLHGVSMEEAVSGGVIMNHDLVSNLEYSRVSNSIDHPKSTGKSRKHSVPYPVGNNMPMVGVKGVLGSGAILNNPANKRSQNNTVTIKTGLEVRNMHFGQQDPPA